MSEFPTIETRIGTDTAWAAQLLREGKNVAVPTETVYGLAGNIFDPQAIAGIYAAKERPSTNPLIVHVPLGFRYGTLAAEVPDIAEELIRRFCPGPLTLLLPKKPHIPDQVTAGSPRVAIRMPDHDLFQELLGKIDFPLAAPSANRYNHISPTTAAHVFKELGSRIPYILDGGACRKGIESTIVGFEGDRIIIYREGLITAEDLLQTGAQVEHKNKEELATVALPGNFKKHYSPETPFWICDRVADYVAGHPEADTVYLLFSQGLPGIAAERQRILSVKGSLEEAASNLYRLLHELDSLGATKIIGEWVPNQGIGMAINDRLGKAGLR